METSKAVGNIRDVLDQVKSGKLDKTVAYHELKDILRQAVNKRSKDVEETAAYLNEARNDPLDDNITIESKSDSSITRFTKEERQLIINKLIEKKRLDRQRKIKDPISSQDFGADPLDDDNSLTDVGDEPEQLPQYDDDDWAEQDQDPSPDYEQYVSSDNISSRSNPLHQQGRPRSRSSNRSNRDDRRSYYDSYNDSYQSSLGRSNRILRSEAAIREEMFRDCTFRPDIKPLPEHYGQPKYLTTPFLQRVSKWQKDKKQQVQQLKKDFDKVATQDCSFHPVINRHSYKAMQELRAESDETVTDRLYREAKSSVEHRNKFLEDELRMQEEINRELCTFRPNLQTRGSYEYIGPKYALTPSRYQQKTPIVTKEMKECTFTPKVRGVRPHMNSAKVYVSEKVVDRLSKPTSAFTTPNAVAKRRSLDDSVVSRSYDIGGNRVMDMASFFDATSNRGRTPSAQRPRQQRSQSAPRERRSNNLARSVSYDEKSATGKDSVDSSADRRSQFESFLLRQKFSVDQKTRRLNEKIEHLRPNFQPELCEKSKKINERNATGEFLDRLERDVLSRKEKLAKFEQTKDVEYSFTPSINEKSSNMRPRSSYEMSRGDLLRKETHHRMNRLKKEQEIAEELTFQPEITRRATTNGKSVIKSVTESSSQFMQWFNEKQRRMDEKRRQLAEEKRLEESKECTFHPETRDCPSYIKRIAKSMEIVRAARNASGAFQTTPPKPDWR